MYGIEPADMGEVDIDLREMMFYLYLPIKLPKHPARHGSLYAKPRRLRPLEPILGLLPITECRDRYVYITCKRTFVSPGKMANRPGWHCDGFGTDDINYIWSDCAPTEFCLQKFDLPDDDAASLAAMNAQAKPENVHTWPDRHLLRLDQRQVHRVSEQPYTGMRTFIKITISRHKFDLEGNSHNHRIDYNWEMRKPGADRNMEHERKCLVS